MYIYFIYRAQRVLLYTQEAASDAINDATPAGGARMAAAAAPHARRTLLLLLSLPVVQLVCLSIRLLGLSL